MLPAIFRFWRRPPGRASASGGDPGGAAPAVGEGGAPVLGCSFCGRSQREVRKLVAGPAVFICDHCIRQGNEVVAFTRSENRTGAPVSHGAAAACSFCRKSPPKVKLLLAALSARICDVCLGLCNDILAEELAEPSPSSEACSPRARGSCGGCGDAVGLTREDWSDLLDGPVAVEAAARGQQEIDLDSGGIVTCPACAHRFTGTGGAAECPECGLALGPAGKPSPHDDREP